MPLLPRVVSNLRPKMTPDDLDSLPDAALNEAFAVEMAGWRFVFPLHGRDRCWFGSPAAIAKFKPEFVHTTPHPDWRSELVLGGENTLPDFCADANQVLPHLEKYGWMGTSGAKEGAAIKVLAGPDASPHEVRATAPTFARCAVIALLRAVRSAKRDK